MPPLRIAFAGTPDFAATSLAALLDDGRHQVVAVLTQPDRRAGRGKKVAQGPVKTLALQHGLPVLQPTTLKDAAVQQELAGLELDLLIVVAYGLIIPQAVLDLPRFGCINVHGSLLPRWRGAAPIQRAIMAGDAETGITIMQMDAGLDTGPMLLAEKLAIGADETGGQLHDRLARQGARLLLTTLADLPRYLDNAQTQPDEGVTYAHKLSKDEARLDFRLPSRALECRIRAFNPWPVCWLPFNDAPLRVWQAHETAIHNGGDAEPGTLLDVDDQGLVVATGDGALTLTQLQLPGKRPMSVADIRRGHPQLFQAGVLLG